MITENMGNPQTPLEETLESIELRKIELLSQPFSETLGKIHHTPVGKDGVIVSFDRLRPVAGGKWVMFDLDETIFQFSKAKEMRLSSYRDYLHQLGMSVTDDQSAMLMKLTDEFSRWAESDGGSSNYHAEAHMIALDWATRQLKNKSNSEFNQVIEDVKTTLNQIKANEASNPPFYLKDGKLHLKEKHAWSKGDQYIHGHHDSENSTLSIDSVFKDTIFKPPLFGELIEAIKTLGSPTDSIHRFNIGFFTKGKKNFQEYKALQLMLDNPDLPISQIWVTEIDKGDFIIEALETGAVSQPELAYAPSELEDYPGDSPSMISSHPLGQYPHVFIHIDDEVKQLNSILSANTYLKEHSGAQFVCVRSLEPNTKTAKQVWEVKTPYGVLDFTSQHLDSRTISLIIKINMYLKLRSMHGVGHPQVQALKTYLNNNGFQDLNTP